MLSIPCLESVRKRISTLLNHLARGTPSKSTGKDGAGPDVQNGPLDTENESGADKPVAKKRRNHTGNAEWILVKQWVTGVRSEMEVDDINR